MACFHIYDKVTFNNQKWVVTDSMWLDTDEGDVGLYEIELLDDANVYCYVRSDQDGVELWQSYLVGRKVVWYEIQTESKEDEFGYPLIMNSVFYNGIVQEVRENGDKVVRLNDGTDKLLRKQCRWFELVI